MDRLQKLSSQIHRNGPESGTIKDDDVVICCSLRTPITRSKKGGFKDTFPEELLEQLFAELFRRVKIQPSDIQDVCIGTVLQPGGGSVSSRMGMVMGGVPTSVPVSTVNRQCSSGLQAVANIAAAIKAGVIEVGVGGGVESMTHFDMNSIIDQEKLAQKIFEDENARNCLLPMGITSENVAERFGVTRQEQDAFAVESHRRAARAQKENLFADEIVPIHVKSEDSNGDEKMSIISKDEGIREGTSMESLEKLKAAFKKGGSTTAGNSSQVSDGASICLLASGRYARLHQLPTLAKFVNFTVVGVPPEIMGIGPAIAIPNVLQKSGMNADDISFFEVNEAFASQCVYCLKKLNLPMDKCNVRGGAIALGHPLGCTGSRQIATLLSIFRERGGRYGIISMCIGTGMGAAAILENLQR